MKGVILAKVADATIVDVTHSVPAFDIHAGAFLVWAGTRNWPVGSIHVAVVDPGVGTERGRMALATATDRFYVGPDNGIFSMVVARDGVREAVQLERPPDAAPTFEGRDVFAPAAARLAAGEPLAALGRALEDPVLLPEGRHRVVWVDAFGNLVTNLEPPVAGVRIHGREVRTAARTFGEGSETEPFWYVGSLGFIEVGIREGRADVALRAGPGSNVEVLPA